MVATCCGQETYGDNDRPRESRRLQLIEQIKQFIGDVEKREHRQGGGGKESRRRVGIRNMDEECREYRKRRDCSPPTITSLAIHETRPTSEYTKMQYENTKQVTFVDATRPDKWNRMPPAPWELPRTPSQELRAGVLYQNCDCTKRNGLQQDCPRWGCGGRPECVATNPGPCCETSKARKPIRGDRRYGGAAKDDTKPQPQSQRHDDGKPSGISSTITCVCRPVETATSTPRVMPNPQPLSHQVLGIVTVTPKVTERQAIGIVQMTPPVSRGQQTPAVLQGSPSGTKMMCFCKPAGGAQSQGNTPVASQVVTPCPEGAQGLMMMSPSGGTYMCCPLQ